MLKEEAVGKHTTHKTHDQEQEHRHKHTHNEANTEDPGREKSMLQQGASSRSMRDTRLAARTSDPIAKASTARIPFGEHPLILEGYREDHRGPRARITRTNRGCASTNRKVDNLWDAACKSRRSRPEEPIFLESTQVNWWWWWWWWWWNNTSTNNKSFVALSLSQGKATNGDDEQTTGSKQDNII